MDSLFTHTPTHHLDTGSTIWKPNYFVYYWYNFLRKNMICSLFFSTSGKTYYTQSNFSLKIAQFDVEDPVLDVSPWKYYCIHTSKMSLTFSTWKPRGHNQASAPHKANRYVAECIRRWRAQLQLCMDLHIHRRGPRRKKKRRKKINGKSFIKVV